MPFVRFELIFPLGRVHSSKPECDAGDPFSHEFSMWADMEHLCRHLTLETVYLLVLVSQKKLSEVLGFSFNVFHSEKWTSLHYIIFVLRFVAETENHVKQGSSLWVFFKSKSQLLQGW